MPVPEDEVHLWYAAADRLDPLTLSRCRELLSPDEVARWQGFRFEHDRHEYLVAHVLVRSVLSSYVGISPGDWRFQAGPHGKPEVQVGRGVPPLRFNLSHTRGLAAVAVAGGGEVGADVEWLGQPVGPDLARWALAEAEYLALQEAPGPDWARTFFSVWTLKEAYLKACGLGLSRSLQDFAFTLSPGEAPRIEFRERGLDDPSRWLFWQDWTCPGYCAAVAVRRTDGGPRRPMRLVSYQADLAAGLGGAAGSAGAWPRNRVVILPAQASGECGTSCPQNLPNGG
jgi:4'-phosphopantetheinyl transferase